MHLPRFRPLVALVVLGIVFVAVGVVWFANYNSGTTSFGWFAYAPMSDTTFPDGVVLLDTRRRLALALVGLGALVLSAVVGYAVGRRNAASSAVPDRTVEN